MSDATFKAALDHFGVQGLVELVVTLAYFAMIALPLNAFEIEMSAAQLAQRKPFAPLEVSGKPWTGAGDGDERPLPPPISGGAPRRSLAWRSLPRTMISPPGTSTSSIA